jgi:hypothetical protein
MDLLLSIKQAYKSKPITITVEDEIHVDLTDEQKAELDRRLQNKDGCLSAEESIARLHSL